MKRNKYILGRASHSHHLGIRIRENEKSQEVHLSKWIFSKLRIRPGIRILELCSGTGSQTRYLAEACGKRGKVVAVDVSRAALNKLRKGMNKNLVTRVSCLETDMSKLNVALKKAGFDKERFDLIFCAYGLYYAANVEATLDDVRGWLKPNGRVVVVGPFGPNNRPLFDLLERCGVTIDPYIKSSSGPFMGAHVLPWAAVCFSHVDVNTLINRVHWKDAKSVMSYWMNSTFFDKDKKGIVDAQLARHFKKSSEFLNEKWIMMIEMSHAR